MCLQEGAIWCIIAVTLAKERKERGKMKILYFSQFYKPEYIAASFRAEENARAWVSMGHEVTVFTGYPNYPKGETFPGYEVKGMSVEEIDGVKVVRSKISPSSNRTMGGRLKSALTFFFWGLFNTLFRGKKIGKGFHVVLGTSGIIFTALLGWLYAFFHRIPFVFELRDISWVQLQIGGKTEKSLSVRVMRFLEKFLCRRAKQVVVVTEGFRDVLAENGIPREKIAVITNGVDISPRPRKAQEGFTLSYFGTLGVSQNILATLPYAQVFSENTEDFTYLLIGDGAQAAEIAAGVAEHPYIQILPGMEAQKLESYYDTTRLGLVTLKKDPAFRHTLPSKLFQIMGRGIAVLFIGPEGEAARLVRRYGAGIALTGTVEEDLAELKAIVSRPGFGESLEQMGRRGAAAVSEHYNRTKLAETYAELLEKVKKHGKI